MFDKVKFRDLLIKAMNGESILQYAKISSINRTYISDYLNLKKDTPLDPDMLRKIAETSNERVAYTQLMLASGHYDNNYDAIAKYLGGVDDLKQYQNKGLIRIPILGTVRAGLPIYAEENVIGYRDIPASEYGGKGELFYLNIVGDSMKDACIINGSKVLVRKQDIVENGEIAVVLVDGEDATIKKVKFVGDMVHLIPANTDYDPLLYRSDEVKIIGKVIETVISY